MAIRKPLNVVSGVVQEIASGDTIEPALLGSGARDGSKFLRDDGAWASSTGGNPEIVTPTNVSPVNSATSVNEAAVLTADTYYSMYGAAQSAIQAQVSTTSDFTSPLYSSGDQAAATSFTVPFATLSVSTTYYWRVRYKNTRGTYSAWSAPTSFTTASVFNDYISTPSATPAAFGDAFEGGYYYGMIWNELVQTASSTTIGTGTKTFTVASMSASPIVYSGQALEIRSRANPNNKMIGTVTGAHSTTLTISVSSVGGGGTFSDWSVMSKYRLIVSPKASGEFSGVKAKSTNTTNPTACITLTEGYKATMAMCAAGDATVYPAAWQCKNMTIAGRTDWYLPARDEIIPMWWNLKPTADNNYTTVNRTVSALDYGVNGSYADTSTSHGVSNNSYPTTTAFATSVPAQVVAGKNFRTGEAEALAYSSSTSNSYITSSELSSSQVWALDSFTTFPGAQDIPLKNSTTVVGRAIRRSII